MMAPFTWCSYPSPNTTTHTPRTPGLPEVPSQALPPKAASPQPKANGPALYHISFNLKQVPSTLALAESTVPPCHPLGLCPVHYCPAWLLKWNPPSQLKASA